MTKSRSVKSPLITFSFLLCAACSRDARDTAAFKSAAEKFSIDTVATVASSVELTSTDSTLVSEPLSLLVTPHSVFVGDVGSASIMRFSRDGHFLQRIGRRGHGPGEFVAPASLALANDSILVVLDPGSNRLSYFGTRTNTLLGATSLPGTSFSVATVGDTVVIGLQDVESKTSAARTTVLKESWVKFGTIPDAILKNAQVARSYPYSVVASNARGYSVGFTGSNLVYRLSRAGTTLDSIVPTVLRRRGVPSDIAERLKQSTSAANEARSTSILIAMAPISDGRTAMVHMDYTVHDRSVTGKAYLSTVAASGVPQCVDISVPVSPDTRPMFSFAGDTLFAVQSHIESNDASRVYVTAFPVPACTH